MSSTVVQEIIQLQKGPDSTSATDAIVIRHLSKTYPVSFPRVRAFFRRPVKEPVEALRDISFEVKTGEIFGLIGRNGAGKTTLTKVVATLVQPDSGTVAIHGKDSVRDDENVRKQIGLATAEERSFYWRLTAEQNLMFFARLHGLADGEAKNRLGYLFTRLELEEVSRRRFGELSTGNKQRLAVARALLPCPPVLLLDEPTRSLDPLAAARMREMIKSLAQQEPPVTILLTSHNLAEVETLCARVAVISRGQIHAIDTPANLRKLTSASERVQLLVTGIEATRAAEGLTTIVGAVITKRDSDIIEISFTREPGDKQLDVAISVVHRNGGRIVDVITERPSLLDLLARYEKEGNKPDFSPN